MSKHYDPNVTMQQALAIGGNDWTAPDGSKHRVYLDVTVWGPLVGADLYDRRDDRTGIRAIDGDSVSNNEESRLLALVLYVDKSGLHLYRNGYAPRVLSLEEILETVGDACRGFDS